ncbi:MAG: UDP-3-O-(3-hydroxymyristoyl)glucosamine N-acyltransferase [Salibacteraceae bacterium]
MGVSYAGPAEHAITGLNEIHKVEPGDLMFVDHPKYYDKALQSKATTILINQEVACPEGNGLLFSDDPFRDYKKLVQALGVFEKAAQSISSSAQIGEGTHLQPGVFVGNHVTIGKDCFIHPNVIIKDHTVIGDRVTIHANTVLGADAFYYKKRPEGFDKLLSCGRVVIEDDVEIGASCTIDRGVSGDTIVGAGSKLDNQVHVGHDTEIGKRCLIAAQVGLAGCVILHDHVTLWGQVGVKSDVTIGEGATVLAQSGLGKNVPPGKTFFGTPAKEARQQMKELAALQYLPEMVQKQG